MIEETIKITEKILLTLIGIATVFATCQEIYFLTNQTNKTQVITPEFRVKNKIPELWLPTTGERRLLPSFDMKKNVTADLLMDQIKRYHRRTVPHKGSWTTSC